MAKNKTVGAEVVSVPVKSGVITAEDFWGKPISLNYKFCDYLGLPSGKVVLDHDNPTFIPRKGELTKEDLLCISKNLGLKRIVQADQPVQRFEKNPDALKRHCDFMKLRIGVEEFKDYLGRVVNGNERDGGYDRIEILEAMLEAEEWNPITKSGGLNRPEFIAELKKAIDYVTKLYGGKVSRVTSEVVRVVKTVGDNGGTPDRPRPSVRSVLDL